MKNSEFIAQAVNNLIEDGFSVKLLMEKCIDGKYGGWFNSDTKEKEFVVAMKHKDSFEIFIHEYSHYLQWKHNRRFFNTRSESCDIVFSWLDGKKYSKKVISEAINHAIEIEWDCEKRALELIKKHKLKVDVDNYIRGANCYLFFYHTVRNLNKWTSNGRSAYSPAMKKIAPNELKELSYYLDENNYNSLLKKKHEKICQSSN